MSMSFSKLGIDVLSRHVAKLSIAIGSPGFD